MKYCIEENYGKLLNLLFKIQKEQASGTVYVLVVNELHIVDTELIACNNNIQVKFKVSEEPKKKAEKFKEYQCFCLNQILMKVYLKFLLKINLIQVSN